MWDSWGTRMEKTQVLPSRRPRSGIGSTQRRKNNNLQVKLSLYRRMGLGEKNPIGWVQMPVWLPLSWWPWAIDFTSPNLTSGNLKNEAIKPILVLQNMNIMQEKLPAHSRYSQIIGSFSILYGMWTLWGQDGWHPSCSLLGPQCRTRSVLSEYLSNGWTDGHIDGYRGTQNSRHHTGD